MGSLEVDTLEPASYYAFRDELIEAGFESSEGGRKWTGPIAEPLRKFTDSDVMTIVFQDGWPFRHPELEVPGMQGYEHVNLEGWLCLWAPGDTSQAWRTLEGWRDRIAEWSERQSGEFERRDATMDAHMYFGTSGLDALAIAPLGEIIAGLNDGDSLSVSGRWSKQEGLLTITAGGGGGNVRGLWLHREQIEAPPTSRERLEAVLTEAQLSRLNKVVAEVEKDKRKHRQFVVLSWERSEANALALLLNQSAGGVRVRAMEFAPSDSATLQFRAGGRAIELADKKVVVFGAGSVGSQLAVLLAESGVGSLGLVDGERLRPGNVVRHAAPASQVGAFKVDATAMVIAEHAPWADVSKTTDSPWEPQELRRLIQDQDLVVNATGNAGFADQLALLCSLEGVPLVSAMLFRNGAVARVQRQANGDTPLAQRIDPKRYPEVPWDPEEEIALEAGCSAPVNLALPSSVSACAARACEVVVDALLDRKLPDEIHEIYQPLADPPFDDAGRLTSA